MIELALAGASAALVGYTSRWLVDKWLRRPRRIKDLAYAMVRVYGDRAEHEVEIDPRKRLGPEHGLWVEVIVECSRARARVLHARQQEREDIELLSEGDRKA